ncbi:hypothetical protein NP233_g9182 [Leucocoprinus birnbaumii]|uniref:Uncharacterized protein n=1 Tax=Leucocoprinus birnbaumii TaxID=56174 RepID=A0AAD5VL14_9AGAR|nr:hypothetical protein NP233_g9182 [Leucocoprinus birnbaumii]
MNATAPPEMAHYKQVKHFRKRLILSNSAVRQPLPTFGKAPWEGRKKSERPQRPSRSATTPAIQTTTNVHLAPTRSFSNVASSSATTPPPPAIADTRSRPADKEPPDIRVEYHPKSHRPPLESILEEFRPPNPTPSFFPEGTTAWSPFKTMSEYQFAQIVLEGSLNRRQTTMLCELYQRCLSGKDTFGFHNAGDLERVMKDVGTVMPSVQERTMTSSFNNLSIEYDFWFTDLWEWAMHLVRSPILASDFTWDAEKLYKYEGDHYVRFYDEPWTADRWHDVQTELPDGAQPLCFILYADKTKLSPFNPQMGYPVMARLANLPAHIRNGNGHGGSYVVGWLPIVEGDEDQKGTKGYVDLKRVVWHDCFIKLLEALAERKNGEHVDCGDRIKRFLFPIILILSADYEEQSIMALIRGYQGSYPCPICLIPAKQQHEITKRHPLRTQEQSKEAVVGASRASTKQDAEKILKEKSLRPVNNAFWTLPHSDPHRALTFDRMHNNAHGLGGKHLWPLLQVTLAQLPAARSKMAVVDERVKNAPRFRDLQHFNKVIDTHFTDATKFETIVKLSLFVTHDLFPKSTECEGYLLLRLIRHYLNIDMYAALNVHTDDTIAAGEKELQLFEECLTEYMSQTASDEHRKVWEFIKLHMLSHLFPDIRSKGVTKNANTQPSESKHRELKKAWAKTNFRNIEGQILRKTGQADAMNLIRARIDATEDAKNPSKTQPRQFKEGTEFDRIDLGSPCAPATFSDAEQNHGGIISFQELDSQVNAFLNAQPSLSAKKLPGEDQYVQDYFPYTEYQFLKVHYASIVDWRGETDYLRCSEEFHNCARYDSIIYNSDGQMQFGELQMVFTIKLRRDDQSDYIIPLCLIRPYEQLTTSGSTRSQKDRDLQFIRLKKKGLKESEVIFAESIERGIVAFPSYDSRAGDEYIIFDVLDPDLFIRLRELAVQ